MNALRRAVISYLKALFGIPDMDRMTPLQQYQHQQRERFMTAAWEHWRLKIVLRRLEKSLGHFDKSLTNIEAKLIQASQRGREDEVLRLTAERARLETSRAAIQVDRNAVSQKMEAIRAQILW